MKKLLALLFLSLFAATGCRKPVGGPARPDLSNRPAKILATTGMIADAVRNVGGDAVEVDCLMGPGVDPHKYVPTPNDLGRLRTADLVLYNGLDLEGKMGETLAARSADRRTVAVADQLPNLRPAEEGHDGHFDPHVWFDVRLWMKSVERVRDALIELNPDRANQFQANADRYLKELDSLDSEVRAKLDKVPRSRRVLITAHDAFGYFGRAYNFEVKGLQGISTASDTSSRDVQELADLIGTRQIPAVFAESSVPSKGMEAVMKAVRMKFKGLEVKLAEEELYSDALGTAGSTGETYIGMVRHNVDAIVKALAN